MTVQPLEIAPYRMADGTWVFDDPRVNLVEEPLIEGTDRVIKLATAALGIADPENGFRLQFADLPFDGWQYRTDFLRADEDRGGNWYWSEDFALEHWLCPALFAYFMEAPASIHVRMMSRM